MDRAVFLRSLSFLRPLPPGIWDNCNGIDGINDGNELCSGTTITPSTPSKNTAMMLFEEPLYAVSIEPTTCSEERMDSVAENNNRQQKSSYNRKRVNGDALSAQADTLPAFFQHHLAPIKTISRKTAMEVQDEDASNTESESMMSQENNDKGETETKIEVNLDPSLCSFEAVIVKKPSSVMDGELDWGNVLATPSRNCRAAINETTKMESKALVFRFGNRFVFHVDESAIVQIRYIPGHDEKSIASRDRDETSSKEIGVKSPPSKRQRNEADSYSHTDKLSSDKAWNLPPSLSIAFHSCTFRVFLLEDISGNNFGSNFATDTDTSRPPSRIWSTLAKTVEPVDSRLLKARLALMQQFEIGNNERNHLTCRMAPPGSGLAVHSWPESFETSSFHSKGIKQKVPDFLEEDWSYCLVKKQSTECSSAATSPQKSSSLSKTSSSSTHFEHGQKEHSSTKNGPLKNAPLKSCSSQYGHGSVNNDDHEENNMSNNSSELTLESQQNKQGSGVKHKESQSPSLDECRQEGKGSNIQRHQARSSNLASDEKKVREDRMDTGSKSANPQEDVLDGIYSRYHLFAASSIHVESAITSGPVMSSSQHQLNEASKSHLTLCAESLSSSYFTVNEFMHVSQESENDIENATSDMETVLDKMFPARGRKLSLLLSDQNEVNRKKIEDLMRLRKEAVAAKLALLMTPKR